MQRKTTLELMDQPSTDPVLVAESLADLAWMNRWLGPTATIGNQMGRLLGHSRPKRLRVLDVAAGGADMLAALDRWCGRRGIEFEGVALDFGRETVRVATAMLSGNGQAERIRIVCGDARALPFGDRRFDVAICSTFLHHLEGDDAAVAVREMARVSDLGIVVSDLRRGHFGQLGAWMLANTVWRRHLYTRHDSIASMRAAYTAREARELAKRAGLAVSVETQRWFRWAMRWKRS